MNAPAHKTCLVIAGPTAVGKTAISIRIAQALGTHIISADSRQCYRELTVGVAKPSAAQLALVPHYFINSHSIHDSFNAAAFERYALQAVRQIFQHHDTAVMVGGTGLYLDAFCNGIDEVPAVDPAIRKAIRDQYAQWGLTWLQAQVKAADPGYFEKGETGNPHRLMRALEVIRSTGSSIRSYQQGTGAARGFRIIKIGLQLPRPDLQRHINHRADEMIREGLVEEVKALLPFRHLQPLNTIGYKEIIAFLNGEITLPAAIELIKVHTRQYAKRQMTWFRRDANIRWFSPLDFAGVQDLISGL